VLCYFASLLCADRAQQNAAFSSVIAATDQPVKWAYDISTMSYPISGTRATTTGLSRRRFCATLRKANPTTEAVIETEIERKSKYEA
jgi:hypothetical protein